MALAVAGYFEDTKHNVNSGWPSAVIERWLIAAKALGCTRLEMVDVSAYRVLQYYRHNDAGFEFGRSASLEVIEERYRGWSRVYLSSEQKLVSVGYPFSTLNKFEHPAGDCLYVVGTDSGKVDITAGRSEETWVAIPTARSGLEIWAEHAAVIALWDRLAKSL